MRVKTLTLVMMNYAEMRAALGFQTLTVEAVMAGFSIPVNGQCWAFVSSYSVCGELMKTTGLLKTGVCENCSDRKSVV